MLCMNDFSWPYPTETKYGRSDIIAKNNAIFFFFSFRQSDAVTKSRLRDHGEDMCISANSNRNF